MSDKHMNPKLKMLLDIAPLAVFFVCYKFFDLFVATAAIMVTTIISLIVTYWQEKKISIMPLVSGIIISVFGTLTLVLHDETFIKMKPTIVNMIFAALLLGGVYFKKSLLKYAMDSAFKLSEEGWRLLSLRWGVFFLFLAALNEFIWRNFSEDFWVNFKVFGMFTLTIIFTILQMPLIKKHLREE
ncbi:MAG: septation protein A [Rickettsiales bacterium]